MSEFLAAAFGFPAVVLSFALIAVLLYWLVAAIGLVGVDLLDPDAGSEIGVGSDSGTSSGTDPGTAGGGVVAALGLGGVPLTVSLSLLIAFSWFGSLVGTVMLDRFDAGSALHWLLGAGALVAALIAAYLLLLLLLVPLRKLRREAPTQSRRDFVGSICVVRTGRVGPDFGQAEVTGADGTTALIQVRQPAEDVPIRPIGSGDRALIFEYDTESDVFWVAPYETVG